MALGLLLVTPVPVQAHAQLVNANPKISAVLAKSPKVVSLTFDDDLIALEGSNIIVVTNSKGKTVSIGATKLSGASVQITLKTNLPLDRYKVTYQVLSVDGHPVSSSYYFYIRKK
ncbi:MAG: copper resistance protein CopC [Micrococcales bacterium]